MTPRTLRHRPRAAFSYVEVCAAIAVLVLCILPAARLLPSLLVGQRDLETRYQLSLVAEQKLESATLSLQGSFVARDESGDLNGLGHPDWHYHLQVTLPAEASGRYALVRIEVWVDEDGDLAPDPAEPQVRYDTIHANAGWRP